MSLNMNNLCFHKLIKQSVFIFKNVVEEKVYFLSCPRETESMNDLQMSNNKSWQHLYNMNIIKLQRNIYKKVHYK